MSTHHTRVTCPNCNADLALAVSATTDEPFPASQPSLIEPPAPLWSPEDVLPEDYGCTASASIPLVPGTPWGMDADFWDRKAASVVTYLDEDQRNVALTGPILCAWWAEIFLRSAADQSPKGGNSLTGQQLFERGPGTLNAKAMRRRVGNWLQHAINANLISAGERLAAADYRTTFGTSEPERVTYAPPPAGAGMNASGGGSEG